MPRYHFTIPQRYAREAHLLDKSITPDDWFDVVAPDEVTARAYVIKFFGNGSFCSVHEDNEEWDNIRGTFYPGRCKKVLNV